MDDAEKAAVTNFGVLAEAQQILGIQDALAKCNVNYDAVEDGWAITTPHDDLSLIHILQLFLFRFSSAGPCASHLPSLAAQLKKLCKPYGLQSFFFSPGRNKKQGAETFRSLYFFAILYGKSSLQNSFLEAPMLLVEDAEDLFKRPVLLFLAGGRPALFLVLCSLRLLGSLSVSLFCGDVYKRQLPGRPIKTFTISAFLLTVVYQMIS